MENIDFSFSFVEFTFEQIFGGIFNMEFSLSGLEERLDGKGLIFGVNQGIA